MMINDQVLSVYPGQWRVAFNNIVLSTVFDTEAEAKLHLRLLANGQPLRTRRTQNNSRKFRRVVSLTS
jgi:hypothetical protein